MTDDLLHAKYFVAYDPYTYWSWKAAMLGAVSVVCPLQGVTKAEWAMSTFVGSYLKERNRTKIPGIAYGWNQVELTYAQETMKDLRPLLQEIKLWGESTVERFARDCYRYNTGARQMSLFEGAMFVRDLYDKQLTDTKESNPP